MSLSISGQNLDISTGTQVAGFTDKFPCTAPNITLLAVPSGENWKIFTNMGQMAGKRTCAYFQYDWEVSTLRFRTVAFFGWLGIDQHYATEGRIKCVSLISNSSPVVDLDNYDGKTEGTPATTNTGYFQWQNVGMTDYDGASRWTRKALVFYRENGDVERVFYSPIVEMHREGTTGTVTILRADNDRECVSEMYITKDPLGASPKGENIGWKSSGYPVFSTIWRGTTGTSTANINRCTTVTPADIDPAKCFRVVCRAGDLWYLGEPIWLGS